MSAAGLTHGGFYKHFGSKGELIATAAQDAFADIHRRIDRAVDESTDAADARQRLVADYVTTAHRDEPGAGCANAALAVDAARTQDDDLRAAYTTGLAETVARLAELDDGSRARALQDLIVLVGSLTLARATAGDAVSEELLEIAREMLAR